VLLRFQEFNISFDVSDSRFVRKRHLISHFARFQYSHETFKCHIAIKYI